MLDNYVSTTALYDPYLSHSGIKGMKWGIRRYQNPDGTLTEEGKRRYGYNLDLNDKSRYNIAKIRTGEARRRFDYAKLHNPSNSYRLAELQGRVRSAKRNENIVKKYDKGSKLAAKGRTIAGNKVRGALAAGAAYLGSKALVGVLNHRINKIAPGDPRYLYVGNMLANIGAVTLFAAAGAYNVKQSINNANLRFYYSGESTGNTSMKRVGSQEYSDRLARSKK